MNCSTWSRIVPVECATNDFNELPKYSYQIHRWCRVNGRWLSWFCFYSLLPDFMSKQPHYFQNGYRLTAFLSHSILCMGVFFCAGNALQRQCLVHVEGSERCHNWENACKQDHIVNAIYLRRKVIFQLFTGILINNEWILRNELKWNLVNLPTARNQFQFWNKTSLNSFEYRIEHHNESIRMQRTSSNIWCHSTNLHSANWTQLLKVFSVARLA